MIMRVINYRVLWLFLFKHQNAVFRERSRIMWVRSSNVELSSMEMRLSDNAINRCLQIWYFRLISRARGDKSFIFIYDVSLTRCKYSRRVSKEKHKKWNWHLASINENSLTAYELSNVRIMTIWSSLCDYIYFPLLSWLLKSIRQRY